MNINEEALTQLRLIFLSRMSCVVCACLLNNGNKTKGDGSKTKSTEAGKKEFLSLKAHQQEGKKRKRRKKILNR